MCNTPVGRNRFETDILVTLAQEVPGSGAYFYESTGCLVVPNTEAVARKVFHSLSDLVGLGKVIVNGPVHGEYLLDIV